MIVSLFISRSEILIFQRVLQCIPSGIFISLNGKWSGEKWILNLKHKIGPWNWARKVLNRLQLISWPSTYYPQLYFVEGEWESNITMIELDTKWPAATQALKNLNRRNKNRFIDGYDDCCNNHLHLKYFYAEKHIMLSTP